MTLRAPTPNRGRLRTADLVAGSLLALAVLVGVLSAPHLPARMTVHWTILDLPYTGVERLGRPVTLALLPVIGALTYGVLRGLTLLQRVRDGLADARPLYDAVGVGVVAMLVLTEVLLVLLNL